MHCPAAAALGGVLGMSGALCLLSLGTLGLSLQGDDSRGDESQGTFSPLPTTFWEL